MKSIYLKLSAGLICAATVVAANAQNTYSGYFLDNYNYRFGMNPAYGNENNFVSFPVLGNMNIGLKGSLNLDQVVYNNNGQTVLFTNPNIPVSEVLDKVGNTNELNANIKIPVMTAGFKALGGYNTIGINLVANMQAGVPKSFFELAKQGISNRTYDISDLRVQANAYGEIALNHSHDLSNLLPGLRVGGAVKVIIGVGNVDAYLHQADLTLGKDNWIARTNADIYASVKGMSYKTKYSEELGRDYVSGFDMDKFGIQGGGLGFDLGATYKWRDFNFSLAVLDLGFITYPTTMLATTEGVQTVQTDAYTFNINGDADNSFSNEFDKLKDDLYNLYGLYDKGDVGSRTRSLATTINWGVDYEFPLYRPLHFGLVNTTRIMGMFTTTEFRLSANVRPVKCLSASANVVVGTYGAAFGWLLNVNTKGFNFFLGMDRTLGKLCKQGIPLKSSAAVNLGIDFPF